MEERQADAPGQLSGRDKPDGATGVAAATSRVVTRIPNQPEGLHAGGVPHRFSRIIPNVLPIAHQTALTISFQV